LSTRVGGPLTRVWFQLDMGDTEENSDFFNPQGIKEGKPPLQGHRDTTYTRYHALLHHHDLQDDNAIEACSLSQYPSTSARLGGGGGGLEACTNGSLDSQGGRDQPCLFELWICSYLRALVCV
jgi:hypothetical protein